MPTAVQVDHLAAALAAVDIAANPRRRRVTEDDIDRVNNAFGGLTPLQCLQRICNKLQLEGPFDSVSQCKRALQGVHIHILDFVNGRLQPLADLAALRRRCKEIGYFPRQQAKSEGLRGLLHHLSGR
eukprot:m.163386 g.163386  ORF g.163386 m.163386 type:complete len:127 (-) comp17110_c7_seq4:812-1192(-)